MSLYAQDILDQILGRVDIAELIGSYIPLKKAGRNFKACCPFHHEKTASFMVSADKQIYHCFGCGAGGNAFQFLIQYERMSFPEAVEFLARKCGIVLPEKRHAADAAGSHQQIYRLNELAACFFSQHLGSAQGARAQRYLRSRGIEPRIAQAFRLGLAPESWDSFLNHARKAGVSEALLEKAGLVLRNQENRLYDRFRNRLMFPIIDAKGSVIAFGGRVLDDGQPKYLNSPETPVYVKGRSLFGLNCAKEAIRRDDRVVIVEGYLDCIVPFQHGLQSIVASLGTALTVDQIRLLKRYTRQMVLVYDGDAAGQNATLRSLDLFLQEGVLPRIVALPAGEDPDSFVIKHGVQRFTGLVDAADSLFDYKLKLLCSRYPVARPEGKAAVCDEMLPTIAAIDNAVLAAEYIRRLGEKLGVAEEHLYVQMKKTTASTGRVPAEPRVPKAAQDDQAALRLHPSEKLLLQLMLREADYLAAVRRQLEAADFQDERVAAVVRMLFALCDQQKLPEPAALLEMVEEPQLRRLICESSVTDADGAKTDIRAVIDDCVRRIKHSRLKERQKRLHEEIKKAQASHDSNRVRALMEEFHILVKRG